MEFDSPRTGGSYRITPDAMQSLAHEDTKNGRIKQQLTTWLIDQRSDGVDVPTITPQIVEYVSSKRPLKVSERADRLLRYLVEEAYELGRVIAFTDLDPDAAEWLAGGGGDLPPHTMSHDKNLFAYAWTESDNWHAVGALLVYLERYEMISMLDPVPGGSEWNQYTVTVNGYARVEEIVGATVGDQGFVAMWFDPSMVEAYDNGTEPAIQSCGYNPKIINRDPTVDKIDDAIIAEIRRSKFMVADFTHGTTGVRGGVYFEAGFAMGLGIPVIFTCRHDMVCQLHFDTRQYNHIVWTDSDELRQRLQERILARIT